MRKIVIGTIALAALFVGGFLIMHTIWRAAPPSPAHHAAPVQPLEAITRSSTVVAPVVVANSAIRDVLEAKTPRNFVGRQDDPMPQLLTGADINWSVQRGPLSLTERTEELEFSTELAGTLHITGTISGIADALVGTIGGLINQGLGQDLRQLTGTIVDQNVEFRGTLTVISHPASSLAGGSNRT